MNKLKIFGKVSAAVMKVGGKAMLKCKKVSPEMLLAGGIVCGVAAVVTAVIATKRAMEDEEIAESQNELEDIDADLQLTDDKEDRRELRRRAWGIYRRLAGKVLRHYIWPIVLVILATGLTLGSHGILKTRYLGTVAAYTALDESFRDYRQRVRDIVGEEDEQRMFDGTNNIRVDHENEDGSVTSSEEKVQTRSKKPSPYEFDFNMRTAPLDATSNSEHNFCYLKAQQCTANDMLHARGHIFLNEVLDLIGLERTPEGAVLGWLENGDGDGCVDFGFSDYYTDELCDMQNGGVSNIHLNMNCDGVIFEKI